MVEFSVSAKKMTPIVVPSAFLRHREPSLFAFYHETCETDDSNVVETPHSPVFLRVIFEKSEMLSLFGSLIGVVSPPAAVILSNSLGSQCVESTR